MRAVLLVLRFAAIVLLPGCLVGAGPVLGLRPQAKVALGYEVSGNLGTVGVEGGNTFGLNGGTTAGYFAVRSTLPLKPTNDDAYVVGLDEETTPHLNLMHGAGRYEGKNSVAAGAAPMMVFGYRGCDPDRHNVQFTITLGVRTIAGLTEIFVAPKVNAYDPLCATF